MDGVDRCLFPTFHFMRLLTVLFKLCNLSRGLALCTMILLSSCMVPGYPYSCQNGTPVLQNPPQQVQVGTAFQPVPPPVMVAPEYGTVVATGYPSPYLYAPAPVLIAPNFYFGYGNGYWYGNRFWPYRTGCAFYGGRYYGGYRTNYWHRGYGGWQGGNYHGGNQNSQGRGGGYGGNWNR